MAQYGKPTYWFVCRQLPVLQRLAAGQPCTPTCFSRLLRSCPEPFRAPCALSTLTPTPPPCPLLRARREERYLKDPDPFDWYQRYNNNPHLRNLIDKAVPRTAAILVPGSGTSRLSEDMLADGYTGGITNIDISRTAIDLMADRCKDRAGLQCA